MSRLIDGDALEELFREVISGIAKRPDMNGNMEHMIRASAMVIEMIKDAPTIEPEPKWIPCSERLPEETVLVTVETKTFRHRYICEAVWIPRWTWKASFDNWEDCLEYNEDEDEFYVNEGWYERVHNWDEYSYVGIEDAVLAWMPLPEPWKEGGE